MSDIYNLKSKWYPSYQGAKLTFVEPTEWDAEPPSYPESKSLNEEDLYSSVNLRIKDDNLYRLKKFINSCKSELLITTILIATKESWEKTINGHTDKVLISFTFKDESEYDVIAEADGYDEEESFE